MDTVNSVGSVRRRTPTKRIKADQKNGAIKVVYISNPMKVSATAAEFMALVQELTGQDAETPPDPSRFQDFGSDDSDRVGGFGLGGAAGGGGGLQTDNCETKSGDEENDGSATDGTVMPQAQVGEKDDKWEGKIESTMEWFEAFYDVDVFTSQMMMDNVSAFYI